jgi:hypothetical protein
LQQDYSQMHVARLPALLAHRLLPARAAVLTQLLGTPGTWVIMQVLTMQAITLPSIQAHCQITN